MVVKVRVIDSFNSKEGEKKDTLGTVSLARVMGVEVGVMEMVLMIEGIYYATG